MLRVTDESGLRRQVRDWRAAGERIAFVPTMGALHEGHLSLISLARHHADRVVSSVFVNPTQFGKGEDFGRYPRQPEEDARLLETAGCDLLFLPEVETIYPDGPERHATFVDPGGPAEGLEGTMRPGHFRGMATVVCCLLNLVQPDVAVFGEKDAQQLAVVRRLVRDLHLPVEIVPGPTVREADGLAMSSRNRYLSPEERAAAPVLYRSLEEARRALKEGERRADEIRRRMREVLESEPLARVEYAEVVSADTYQPVETIEGSIVIPLAVRIGGTRLIDNVHTTVAG